MLDAKAIGQRIKIVRGKATQQEFASMLEVGRASLTRYELGERPPDLEFVDKLYNVCKIDPLWLMTGLSGHQPMEPEEQLLLSRFRTCNPDLRDAALRVVLGATTERSRLVIKGGKNSRFAGNNYNEAKKETDI